MPDADARQAMARMGAIHGTVEQKRGTTIPGWAYRDVLYMLIDYSERAYQTLHRPLTPAERDELYAVFRQVGVGMHVAGVDSANLPATYTDWKTDRQQHLDRDLVRSDYTDKLFQRYRDQLGSWRYTLLREAQAVLVPEVVRQRLDLPKKPLLARTIGLYKLLNAFGLRAVVQRILLPTEYLAQIQGLDRQ